MGFFDRSNESASPIGLLRAHIGTFMYCVKMGKKKFQNKEDVGDIFLIWTRRSFFWIRRHGAHFTISTAYRFRSLGCGCP